MPSTCPTQFTRKKIEAYSYGLNDEIGKGYSSKVYRGRHDASDLPVAVKVIDLKMLKNDINRSLLESQIQILKELKSMPHILSLKDVFTTKNNTYIVTELCDGDLSSNIKKKLTSTQVYRLMGELIQGVTSYQQRGIIHRDLKPANLLMVDGKLKIADFGFGIKVSDLAFSSKYNVGSPLYMAPESLRKNDYSFKSDIWSLGVILFQMLFGQTPWRAKNEKQLIKKIQTESIQSILSKKTVDSNARQFLLKSLSVEKQSRMSKEDLSSFSFKNQNILGEKVMNSLKSDWQSDLALNNHKPPCDYRTMRENRYEKRIVTQNGINHAEETIFDNKSQVQGHKINKNRQESLSRQQKKAISKVLISQVHLCRFLFKLIQRIRQSQNKGLLQDLLETQNLVGFFTSIIKVKVEDLLSFDTINFIKCQGYSEYKKSEDCMKVLKISKEYSERYQNQLKNHWNSNQRRTQASLGDLIMALALKLQGKARDSLNPEQDIGLMSDDIIILDYLLTARQLISMINASSPQDYQLFSKKSHIQEIVEGKTVEIDIRLYRQIMERAAQTIQTNKQVNRSVTNSNSHHLLNKIVRPTSTIL